MTSQATPVERFLANRTTPPEHSAFPALTEAIEKRFGEALSGIVFYGSVLHGLADKGDALHDLLVVVDSYTAAYDSIVSRISNWCLPPNVFYLETTKNSEEFRCKYTVISLADFERYTRRQCRQVYFWGRYCQPCAIGFARDDSTREKLISILAQAAITFATTTISLRNPRFSVSEFWIGGLSACYGAELRPEDTDRAAKIVAQASEHYRTLALLSLPAVGTQAEDLMTEDPVFINPYNGFALTWRRLGWMRRRLEGKILNLMRLIKAVFTFDGGVDYALWKIRRHSGVEVEVSDRVRKHPLLFGWPTFFRLWRQGVFSSKRSPEAPDSTP